MCGETVCSCGCVAALEEAGHMWIGCDVSKDMLDVCVDREDMKGDAYLLDMGMGLPLRAGVFDGCIRYIISSCQKTSLCIFIECIHSLLYQFSYDTIRLIQQMSLIVSFTLLGCTCLPQTIHVVG